MLSKNLIINEFPVLLPDDTGNRALDIMENYLISHLAVVDDKKYKGMIAMDDIYNYDLFDTRIKDIKTPLINAFIYENQHIFNVIKSLTLFNTSIIPVIDQDSNYTGTITRSSLINSLADALFVKEDGFIFALKMNIADYSATEIANIIEKNDAKLLSLFIDNNNKNSREITVYTKIQTQDIEAVMQSFERFDYDFILLDKELNDYDDLYKERFDNFMNYLNI